MSGGRESKGRLSGKAYSIANAKDFTKVWFFSMCRHFFLVSILVGVFALIRIQSAGLILIISNTREIETIWKFSLLHSSVMYIFIWSNSGNSSCYLLNRPSRPGGNIWRFIFRYFFYDSILDTNLVESCRIHTWLVKDASPKWIFQELFCICMHSKHSKGKRELVYLSFLPRQTYNQSFLECVG